LLVALIAESEAAGTPARIVMHIDFDYFYAQCEEVRNPALKGKPLAVCVFSGRTRDSGVISTANYAARKYGVKSGMPIRLAKARLADVAGATFLPIDMDYYTRVSERAMTLIESFADKFEQVGIDECFIDVTRQARNYSGARIIASEIKRAVRESAAITATVGVAPNKLVAKIASDFQKPDGLTVVEAASVEKFISGLEVSKISGIGPKTAGKLKEMGATTVGDISRIDQFRLTEALGKKAAAYIRNAARGIDEDPVRETGERKQIARIVTLRTDANTSAEMSEDLSVLCRSVAEIAGARALSFKTIGVLLFLNNLDQRSRSKTLKTHTSSLQVLSSTARKLLADLMVAGSDGIKVRRLGVRISDLHDSSGQNTISSFMKD
jgi:DNA polymerase IV (DinB-like DNA polymerase)